MQNMRSQQTTVAAREIALYGSTRQKMDESIRSTLAYQERRCHILADGLVVQAQQALDAGDSKEATRLLNRVLYILREYVGKGM